MAAFSDWDKTPAIAGLTPWLCSYDGADGRYSITLYGSDPSQILRDHSAKLHGLSVDGQSIATTKGGA